MNNIEDQDRNKEELPAESEDTNKEESKTESQDQKKEESKEEPSTEETSKEETSSGDSSEKVHTSELNTLEEEDVQEILEETPEENLTTTEIATLIQETHYINQRLDTITNILLVSMIGIALVVGVLACSIFAKYFRS